MSGKDRDGKVKGDQHNARGIELADRGWLDEAVKEFKKAIACDPDSAHAHDNLATVYAEKKLFREALDEYLAALRLEPESATAHYNLACFLSTYAGEMSVEQYKEAIELEPDYADAHLNLGITYADLDRRDEAKSQLQIAIRLDAADPVARHELAALHMDEADYRPAIALLKDVTRLDPESHEAWLDLGICYAQKGFYEEAERSYQKAQALQPDDALLNYNIAALYALWEKPGQALAPLKLALEKEPAKVRAWLAADPMFDRLKGVDEFDRLISLQ